MLALAAAVVLVGQSASLDIKPTSVRQALVTLSERYGKPLAVESRLANEIVVLRIKKPTQQKVLDGLARVLHAEWQADRTGLKLVRPNEEQKKLEQAVLDARTASIQQILDKLRKQLGQAKNPSARAEELVAAIKKQNDYIKEMTEQGKSFGVSLDIPRLAGPAGRLMFELLIKIGAKDLATIDYRGSRIYSNVPTAAESPFPPGAEEDIRDYIETEQQLQGYFQNGKLTVGHDYRDAFDAAMKPGGVGKVILSVHGGTILGYGITVYTKDGKSRVFVAGNSSYVTDPSEAENKAGRGLKPVKIPLSPLAKELYDLAPAHPEYGGYDELGRSTPRKQFSPELWAAIMRPDQIDPLLLLTGDAVYAIADQKDEDLIGCLPDSLYTAARSCRDKDLIDVARFEAICKPVGAALVEHESGTTFISCKSPSVSELYRLPRMGLTRALKAFTKEGTETLDDFARFHYDVGWAVFSYVARIYRRLAHYNGVAELRESEAHSHQFYAFLGSLDATQLRTLRGGSPIYFSQLSPAQRAAGEKYALGAWYEQPEGTPDYIVIPQESMPNGPPSSLAFVYEPQNVQTIQRYDKNPNPMFTDSPSSAEEYGRGIASTSKLNKRDLRPDYFHNQFTLGERRQEIYSLYVTRQLKASDTFKIDKAERSAPIDFAQLPQSLRDEIERFYQEEMKRSEG